jgi:hypothetical protein
MAAEMEDDNQERRRLVRVARETVVVGLVATPPDFPARIAERITDELADLLARHVDGDTVWAVRTGWGEVAPRRGGGPQALLDDMARRAADEGWNVAICLTDLPFQRDRRPVVALCSWRRRAALISLPALGFVQLRTVRMLLPSLVRRLVGDTPPNPNAERRVAPVHRVLAGDQDGEIGWVASRLRGGLRLVLGMVRANRPGRALLGLSKLLVGAFGTAAFALATNTIWQMGDKLGPVRLSAVMLIGLTSLVTWLIAAHHLWEKPDEDTTPQLARLFNLGTILTLGLATTLSYVVLFAGTAAAAALLIDPSLLRSELGHGVGPADYLNLAWIISSMATIGGAIGSGLEDEASVRAAAYGYHPAPSGWQDGDDRLGS